jgi:arginyl-tRNA synthetase
LAERPHRLAEAGREYSPAVVANYCYELAKDYNRFHYEVPVLKAEDPAVVAQRLALCRQTARTLAFGLGLLGIRAPERM